jgi:biotin carboxylase
MKERLLFVAAGPAQARVIREARCAGYHVIAMDGSSDAPGFAEADEFRVANILDAAEIIRVFRETRAEAIISVCCDVAMDAVATACHSLEIPGIPPDVARISRRKMLQREAFRSAGLLTPMFRTVTNLEDAFNAFDFFQAESYVLKPVDSSGSRGVSFVGARENLPDAFEQARQNSPSGLVMVESFMPGTEYSVEAWVVGAEVHVLATSEKLRSRPPSLLDRQVHFPDRLPSSRRQMMIEHAVRAIKACGFRDCPVHLECIDHKLGPMIVELAARGAGFKVFTDILPKVTGISTSRASIDSALGKSPDLTLKPEGSAASLVFVDPVPGIFKAAYGLDAVRALPGVVEVVLYVEQGQKLNSLRSGSDRAGHILVYEKDANACRSIAQKALDLIRLETMP